MKQLMREVLEQDPVEPPARTIELAAILELTMSITTEQLGAGNPLDAVANPDPADAEKALADAAALTPEESIAANRQMVSDYLARPASRPQSIA
jgi:hypothetical protein